MKKIDNFWDRQALSRDGAVVVEVRGVRRHFRISKAPGGHGGVLWVIVYLDGRVEETHSLWGQGDIPRCEHHRFPVNAKLCQKVGLKDGSIQHWTLEEIDARRDDIKVFY